MQKQTTVTVVISDLTEEEFSEGMKWFSVNAVSYQYQENERYFILTDPSDEQLTSLEDSIQNGFTPVEGQ